MKKLLQISPVIRMSTSTGRIMREIGEIAMSHGWDSTIAYSRGRDGLLQCSSKIMPVGGYLSTAWHGVMTRLFDRHGLASKTATRKFISDIKKLDPDIIHIHNLHGYFLHYPTFFDFLAKSGIKVVWTVHDCWMYTGHCYYYSYAGCRRWQTGCGSCPQTREFPRSLFRDRSATNFADKRRAFTSLPKENVVIVPVSEWMRGEMSRSFMKDFNYRVIHNGINTDVFSPRQEETVRRRYGIPGNAHIILGLASIWLREKGFDDFIEMSRRLNSDEVIVMVGVDSARMKRLPSNIVAIRRTDNVGQLAELYSAATVFVNPTWQDNYPTVNLESISCGTPVVTYRTGGSVEAITPETGIIVPQGDIQATLEAVRTIESNGKEYYRDNCRRFALAHFKKEDRYLEYLNLYDELL